jgi:fructosamine-3-kinase
MEKDFLVHIQQLLSQHFAKEIAILHWQQVFGGDINQTFVLTDNLNRKFFLKLNSIAQKDMFEKEFNGLRLLRTTNSLFVPPPVLQGSFHDSIFLVMEYLEKGNPTKTFWKEFATGLAKFHQTTHPFFGLEEDNYIGSLYQSNHYCSEWEQFYASQRILPLFHLAFQQQKCKEQDVRDAERLCQKLHMIFPNEPPSLIHGDLWGGNFMCVRDGRAAIYDPAVYYGHREMDIAMSLLFGGFDSSFYTYYNEVFPLEKSWRDRVELCQLYPLLVHLILFGGHYYSSVKEILHKY